MRHFKKNTLEELRTFIGQYAPEDVLNAIFCLSCWSNNRGAVLQHRAIYLTLFTIPIEQFHRLSSINDYASFNKFCDQIIRISKDLGTHEDFVPEGDWGEVRYFYQDRFFKVICGDDLSYSYDQLQSFEMLINAASAEVTKLTKRNPSNHLNYLLSIYDSIATKISIDTQGIDDQASPGYMECPSEIFFQEVTANYPKIISDLDFSNDFKSEFFASLGDLK